MSETRERELVEKVARALWNEMYPEGTSWDDWARNVAERGGFDGRDSARKFARAAIEALSASTQVDAMREALDIEGIQKLAADVNFYSGNEASGRAEILRRKAAAWDRVAATLSAQPKTTSPSSLSSSHVSQ